ncbi:MAG TPA: DNA repair protein RecN [Porphyromonadaceae bacterium]|jgi:DNA repair protein RecN (Recombination protein N)|nr:DNA repair protein RecN [Porphyromonadaceae bacterium]
MLKSLHISNYALIDSLDIEFDSGLNIITGETGAGKSIIIGALSMLLGGRTDTKAIRREDMKSVIEGMFSLSPSTPLADILKSADVDFDPATCILRREISPGGRSRAFINDTPVNLTLLREVGLHLVDIHSQHQNQLLATPDFQLNVIDALASNQQLLEEYGKLYSSFRDALHKLKVFKAGVERDKANADFMQFQLEQLEELNLHPGELDTLEQSRDQLADSTRGKSLANEALDALKTGDSNILSLIETARDAIADLETFTDSVRNQNLLDRLESASIELNDIAETIETIDASILVDPSELEIADARITEIRAMMRKHGVETESELIAIRDRLEHRLSHLAEADSLALRLETQAKRAKSRARELARTISERRAEAASDFGEKLIETARPLGMKNLQVNIAVEPSELGPTGMDAVEFRFAFNKNQEPIPVGGAASGGEISRIMLSIKSIIANRIELPSIIFDEVDTGVSGDVANRMGLMMLDLAAGLQVIAITHLPQVAAKGKVHFKVFKEDDDLSTHTRMERLTPERRIDELALMLSGSPDDESARHTAGKLLGLS